MKFNPLRGGKLERGSEPPFEMWFIIVSSEC